MNHDHLTAPVAQATAALNAHDEARKPLLQTRDAAILRAINGGHTIAHLVRVTGLSRTHVERIARELPRTGNRNPAQWNRDSRTPPPEGPATGGDVSTPQNRSQRPDSDEGDYGREKWVDPA